MSINWNVSKQDDKAIIAIVLRANERDAMGRAGRRALLMDLVATHLNGCPLDLEKLRAASEGDFWHDIRGIQRHINRDTGALDGFFLPRCAQPGKGL